MSKLVSLCCCAFLVICCTKQDPSEIELIYQDATPYQLYSLEKFNDHILIAGGQLWESGQVIVYDPILQSRISDADHAASILALDTYEENAYGIGIENLLFAYENESWTKSKLDSNFIARGIVVTEDVILTTGGVAYAKGHIQRVDPSTHKVMQTHNFDRQLNDICALDKDRFIAVGYGGIYSSFDRGITWILNDLEGDRFNACYKHEETDEIFILGQSGLVYKTLDGIEFEKLRSKKTEIGGYHDIYRLPDLRLVVVGDDATVMVSDVTGREWKDLRIDSESNFLSVTGIDGQLFISSSAGEIFKIAM